MSGSLVLLNLPAVNLTFFAQTDERLLLRAAEVSEGGLLSLSAQALSDDRCLWNTTVRQ